MATKKAPSPATDDTAVKEEGTPAPGPNPDAANLDDIALELSASMPEVQEHAIEQESLNESAKVAQFSHLRDRDGNPFDAAIHKTNASGEPVVTAGGKLTKKPGRKAGSGPTAPRSSVVSGIPQAQAQAQHAEQVRANSRATGAMTANLLLSIGVMIGGDEWQPRVDKNIGLNEKEYLETAFADYFEATGKTDLPPGAVLAIALTGYIGPRMAMPKTKTRIGRAYGAAKKWWINKKLKKHGLKADDVENKDKKPHTMEA